ncbi:acyl-CoA dehydrogenase family protein [Microbacterium sp.]|uniref:acyl-CoA dehydrogenase family protein n=1 Tax=Microbacterium sp. TaxID=51671 RepID=UPI0039E4D146
MSAEIDRLGAYPEQAMRLLEEMGFYDITVPRALGGVAADDELDDAEALIEILINLGAGESSTAQVWEFSRHLGLVAFGPNSPLSEQARGELFARIAKEDRPIRFCGTGAERYKVRHSYEMKVTPVDGGVVVNGTKYFATGVDGADYAFAPGCLDGFPSYLEGGAYEVLIDLRSEGVHIHGDWDNMGQRATGSGAVTYEGVFVPDGYHWPRTTQETTASPIGSAHLVLVMAGIGAGALDALAEFVKNRTSYPGALEDPIIQFQFGEYEYRLRAAQMAVRESIRLSVAHHRTGTPSKAESVLSIHAAKLALIDALTRVTSTMHNLCGGQGTSNSYDLDRFWRNARTLASQDVMDLKQRALGAWALTGELPQGAR